MLECLGIEPLGIMGLAAEFAPKVCSGHWPRETRRNLCHWSGRVPGCLGPTGPSYFLCWGRYCVPLTSDPMILAVVGRLGVDLPLGVVGLAAEFVLKVFVY